MWLLSIKEGHNPITLSSLWLQPASASKCQEKERFPRGPEIPGPRNSSRTLSSLSLSASRHRTDWSVWIHTRAAWDEHSTAHISKTDLSFCSNNLMFSLEHMSITKQTKCLKQTTKYPTGSHPNQDFSLSRVLSPLFTFFLKIILVLCVAIQFTLLNNTSRQLWYNFKQSKQGVLRLPHPSF